MNLLVITSLTRTATANYFINAFKRSGHEVLVCSDISGPQVDVVASGLVDMPDVLRRQSFAADAIVFIEGGSMKLLPDTSLATHLPSVWYAIDTHMDVDKHVRVGRLFDMSFVAQKQYVTVLSECGVRHAQWLPLAFAPEMAPGDAISRDIDVAYVGSQNAALHPERMAMLNALRSEDICTQFGSASPAEMARIYAGAKLVFNRSVSNDINMRFFEAMGAGSVLLTDPITNNGVEDLFTDGVHYVSYRSKESLVQITRELLANPVRCQEIGEAARQLVFSRHTYRHRADELLMKLQGIVKSSSPSASDVFAACVSLGLTADALRSAGRALATVRGGRFQQALGVSAVPCLKAMAAVAGGAERLRRAAMGTRHA